MDCVNVALGNRAVTVKAARKSGKSGEPWYVHMLLNEFHAIIFAWLCVLSDHPPVLWWLSAGQEKDVVT